MRKITKGTYVGGLQTKCNTSTRSSRSSPNKAKRNELELLKMNVVTVANCEPDCVTAWTVTSIKGDNWKRDCIFTLRVVGHKFDNFVSKMDSLCAYALAAVIVTILALSPRAANAAFSWTVSLTVSNESGSDFEGPVEVVAEFENGTRNSVLLPFNRYHVGREYSFPVNFASPDHFSSVYLRTRGFCPLGLLPSDTLRLQRLTLVSNEKNVTYTKAVHDLVIQDACRVAGDTRRTDIRELDRVEVADLDTTDECALDGVVYAPGQSFEMNCRLRCTCDRGTIACVDNCPTAAWTPEQKCRLVSIPSQCCDEVRCEEDPRMRSCQMPKNAGTLKGELLNGDRSTMGGVRRYPWAVLICVDDGCRTTYGGTIVSERHILTLAPDFRDAKTLRVALGAHASLRQPKIGFRNIIIHPDFVTLGANGSAVPNSLYRLQLIEMNEPLGFDKELKAANLPLSSAQCARLSSSECPVMTVGWDPADSGADDSTKRMYLNAQLSQLDPRLCDNGLFSTKSGRILTFAKSSGGKRTCVSGLIRRDCDGPTGGVIVITAADNTDFVIGLTDAGQSWTPKGCAKPGTAPVLSLCKYVDWIASSISYHRR